MQNDDSGAKKMEVNASDDRSATELTIRNLDAQDVEDLAEFLENQPDTATEALIQSMPGSQSILASNALLEIDEEEQLELLAHVAQVLAMPPAPPAASLGELRACARLTVDDVAEKVGLFVETIDYMEEDIPIVETPLPLLRALGNLYGYSAAQVDAVLRSQGSQGISTAAYKLRRGSTGPGRSPSNTSTARSFSQVLADTGATEEQAQRWFAEGGHDDVEDDSLLGIEGDLFA